MVGGRNKYIVNGHNAQQQAVTNLFQSVQLNVNNPHFLIMQGKITKVLNMKPPEILAMIEEAAGTRMFEERKEKAFKTIVKKEKKLQELLTILNEEIGPKLEKLRAEKRAYLDYQKIEIEYDRMKRLIVAHQYYSNAQFIQSNESDHSNNVRLAEKLKSELDMVLKQIPSIESEIQRLTDQLNNSGSNTSKLSSKLKQLSNDIVRMKTQADIKSSTLNEENNNLSQMKSGVFEARAALEEKTNIKQNHQAEYEQIKTNYNLQFQKVQNMEDLLQSLKTGISSKEGQGTGFMDQIRVAQGEATQAATQIQQAKIKDTHLASELEKCQRNVNNALNENQATVTKRDQAKTELDKLQSNLDSLNFQPEIEKKLVETRSAMQSQLKVLQRDYNTISSRISNLDFSYSDPHPNFDRSQVRGLVAELISLDSGNSKFSTALEICAGGRLYNVVVENESVGALLLEKGRLRKKVTIIPLNKIKPYIASDQAVNTASSIAPGKVNLALTLVGYNNDVSKALEYVFGNTFICDDPSTANLVTFNERVKTKSVTLDGDVYDPSGTLQGGSKPQSSGILIQINEMNEIKKKISHLTKEIENTTEQINQLNQVSSNYKILSQKIDLKKHEITLYDKQISTSSHSNIENRIKAIIEERQTLLLQTQSLETKRKAAIQEANRLEIEMNDFNSNKTTKLQDMEKQLSNERSTLEKVTKTYKQAEAEYTTLQLEIEQLQADLASSEAQLSEAESNFASLQSEDQEIKNNIQEYQAQYNTMKSELQKLTAARKQEDKEIKELEELKRTRVNEEADLQVKIKKVTYSIDRAQQQEQQAQKIVQQLDSEYDWISAQKDQFGQPNTQYDFSKFDIEDCTQQLQVLEERYNLLRKKINAKVMNTIDSVEKQESTLKQMLNTIKRDKNKIEDTIHSLDDYKKEALHNTWTKVSR
jgi:structural maintenance of chromosome 2